MRYFYKGIADKVSREIKILQRQYSCWYHHSTDGYVTYGWLFFPGAKSGTTLSWWVPAIIWLNMLFIVGLLPIAFAKYDLYKAAGNYKNKPRKKETCRIINPSGPMRLLWR